MNSEDFQKLRKDKFEETVDSIVQFANCILNNESAVDFTVSEIELAHHLRLAIIFYRAREDKQNEKTIDEI